MKKYWMGSVNDCDFCHSKIDTEFIDGATTSGPWALMCPKCFNIHGTGLGLGKGQRYKKDKNGKFEKIEG